jgi:signal transduction histidine kinase/ligand-binding sensor domain-containing protein
MAVQLIKALLFAALLLQPLPAAAAAGHERRLAHYTHQRWSEGSEAPAPVLAMAQAPDGFIWLASDQGLFRFDGISFEQIDARARNGLVDPPSALLVTRNGDVWTNLQLSRRFAFYRAGRLRLSSAPPAPARIIALAEGADGAIWAMTSNHHAEVLRLQNGRWQRFNQAQGLPGDEPLSMLTASDGAVWVSTGGAVSRLAPGASRFGTVRLTPGANGRLSQDPAGRIWLSERRGSYPVSGPRGVGAAPILRFNYPTDESQIRGTPRFDRAGNLWIAMRYGGVQRVASADPAGARSQAEAAAQVDYFRNSNGLSSDVTYQVLEDREGNIWIGTEKGLDKLRPSTVRSEPALNAPAAFGDKLMAASDGSVYIGQSRTIYRVRPGGNPEPILHDIHEPQSICEAPDGAIWIAFNNHVLVWQNGWIRRRFERPGTGSTIYDCAFDAQGDFWISAAAGGLHRYRNGRWERMFGPGDANDYPMTMARDSSGRLVVQWRLRTLAWIDYPAHRVAPLDFGAARPDAVTIYPTAHGDVLVAGAFGLSRFRDGRSQTRWADLASDSSRISGIVQTPEGDTWLAYPAALVRIRSRDLDRAFSEPGYSPPRLSLGAGDGLASRPHSHSQTSIVRGGDGRIWIATETGTLWMDPRRIERNALPPRIAIKSVTADGIFYRDPVGLSLEAATSNIEIDFAALSFADPRQVAVRYRLEGYDSGWIDPGARRQAFYTNLSPGRYRFHVIAANEAGVWNRDGASVDFDIPPTFFQSGWFLALCIILALVLLWLFYRLRVAQIAGRIRSGLEERLGERERIARELHDTLLQSVQGLILRFQSVANKMPVEAANRAHLESALERADEIMAEGRDRVHDLRAADGPDDLAELLKERAVAAGFDPTVPIRIVVEGKPRPVHPLVSAEIDRIAGEALFNVARHARASNVEVTVRFGARLLGVEIRDDGIGIAQDVLERGDKPGHFGLIGMRERAARIGGNLSIDSHPGLGCTVTISLPARLAFTDHAPRRRRFSRLFFRRKEPARA